MPRLTDKAWSPYVAGIIIGLLQIPAFLLIETAIGASSSYVKVAGHLLSVFDANILDNPYFAKYMTAGKYWWQLALVIAVAAGAFLSAWSSDSLRGAISPIWRRALGTPSLPVRFGTAFVGGFVMLFGARLAGGCTSGHGLSGLAQLSVSSTVAIAALFVGGIATAMMMRRI